MLTRNGADVRDEKGHQIAPQVKSLKLFQRSPGWTFSAVFVVPLIVIALPHRPSCARSCGVLNWPGPSPRSPHDFTQTPFLSTLAQKRSASESPRRPRQPRLPMSHAGGECPSQHAQRAFARMGWASQREPRLAFASRGGGLQQIVDGFGIFLDVLREPARDEALPREALRAAAFEAVEFVRGIGLL